MVDKIKVLMTGAGAPGGPGIIQALKKDNNIHLHIEDANPNSSGRYMSVDCPFYKLPKASDSSFIEFLLDLCVELGINVIFP